MKAGTLEIDFLTNLARLKGDMDAADRAVAAAGGSMGRSLVAVNKSAGQARASMQNLGFQFQDFAVQVVGGTSPLRAFAQQFPQAAGALGGFGGSLGKVGAFLAGPWGIALTVATTVVAGLAAKLFDGAAAAKKQEGAIRTLADAHAALTKQTDSLVNSQDQELARSTAITKAALNESLAKRAVLAADLARATANQDIIAKSAGGGDLAAGIGYTVGQASAAVAANAAAIAQAKRDLLGADAIGVIKAVAAATDKVTAARQRYEDQEKRVTRAVASGQIAQSDGIQMLIRAKGALSAVENADKNAAAAKRDHNNELRDAAKAQREAAAASKAAARDQLEDLRDQEQAWRDAYQARQSLDELMARGGGLVQTGDIYAGLKDLPPMIDLATDAAERQQAVWDDIASAVDQAAASMERAFGRVGASIGDAMAILVSYGKQQDAITEQARVEHWSESKLIKANADLQLNSLVGLTDAAKGLFSEHSKGYKAMEAAERALTIVQLARTAVDVAGGAARMFASLGPLAFPAVGAMLAVMATLGFASGGSGGSYKPQTNTGTGTVLGDSSAKSESIARAIDMLKDIDTVTMTHSAAMAASLRSIDQHIGGLSTLLVRTGNINASAGVPTGFDTNAVGSILKAAVPLFGGVLASLFGTKTSVIGSGVTAGAQSLDSILGGGFDASYYSDIEKKKKLFGLTTSTKYSTQTTGADDQIEAQFGLILKGFYDTIAAAASPLGEATGAVEDRLKGFVVNIGKIDLQGLSGTEIQEKLSAVFGAAADDMARAAIPGLNQFQKVGEGAFETLTRVASTVEAVTVSLDQLGLSSQSLGIDASMAIAGMFDSVADYTSAADAYFKSYYSEAEQAAKRTEQLSNAFTSLGMTMPDSIANYRALVEAQDLTTDAGQSAYAMLLKLAPAFADLQSAGEGASGGLASAAAIVRQREDLEQKLLQMSGDTVAIRAAELAQLDPSNRALQQRIYDLTDEAAATQAASAAAQEAARVADQAAQAETQRLAAVESERAGLDRQWLELTGQTAAIRALDLAKLDASNQALQLMIWARQDEIDATAKATAAAEAQAQAEAQAAEQEMQRLKAITDEREGLERQLLELMGDTNAIRALDLAKLDESNRALQEHIWALQDQATATAAATQAAETAAAAQKAIADERAGLDRQYLELTGDTAAIRALDLAKLDESNRARQQEIWALTDQATATNAATQAAQEAAAKQAAIANERMGLEKQLLQLQGNTAALRALELDGLDASNRALQQQIYALQDAQEAAKAADALRQAWQSVGDTIMDEVKRIRGLGDTAGATGYASLLGQFNVATIGARGGDIDIAKNLPTLSKALLDAAAQAATSRQELDRIQAMIAGSLEETYGLITSATMASQAATDAITGGGSSGADASNWWNAFASAGTTANDNGGDIAGLRADLKRTEDRLVDALAQIASFDGRTARVLERLEAQGEGDGLAVKVAA